MGAHLVDVADSFLNFYFMGFNIFLMLNNFLNFFFKLRSFCFLCSHRRLYLNYDLLLFFSPATLLFPGLLLRLVLCLLLELTTGLPLRSLLNLLITFLLRLISNSPTEFLFDFLLHLLFFNQHFFCSVFTFFIRLSFLDWFSCFFFLYFFYFFYFLHFLYFSFIQSPCFF